MPKHIFRLLALLLGVVVVAIIALNMVGSITDHVDLVVTDPVQIGRASCRERV